MTLAWVYYFRDFYSNVHVSVFILDEQLKTLHQRSRHSLLHLGSPFYMGVVVILIKKNMISHQKFWMTEAANGNTSKREIYDLPCL